jgi:hypothetical protein
MRRFRWAEAKTSTKIATVVFWLLVAYMLVVFLR